MKITIQHYDIKHTLEFNDEDCTEVLRRITALLLSMGFHPSSVDNSILELAEEIENAREETEKNKT